jgi:hypothetical protein
MSFGTLLQAADAAVLGHLPGDEVIIYTPGVGVAVTVVGVYDAAYQKVEAGNGGVSDSAPAVFLRLEDLPSDPSDDADARVTVDGMVCRVREAKPDGRGMTLLFLQQVA